MSIFTDVSVFVGGVGSKNNDYNIISVGLEFHDLTFSNLHNLFYNSCRKPLRILWPHTFQFAKCREMISLVDF